MCELPRPAVCSHLLVLHLPLAGVLLMLLAFCVGVRFESRHPQLAVGALASLRGRAIELPSTRSSAARLPVGRWFLCSPSCSVCPPTSLCVLVLLSCKIPTGNTQKFMLVKTEVQPQHSGVNECSKSAIPWTAKASVSYSTQLEGTAGTCSLRLARPSEPGGELGCPVSRRGSLTFPPWG